LRTQPRPELVSRV